MRIIPGGQLYAPTGPPPGPDVYYYSAGHSAGNGGDSFTHAGWQPSSYIYGAPVIVGQSGEITSIGIYGIQDNANAAFKIAVYDANGDLLVDGSGTLITTQQWHDVSVAATNVTAQTIDVFASSVDNSAWWGYTGSTSGGWFIEEAYSAFPSDPRGTRGVEDTYAVRVYVD